MKLQITGPWRGVVLIACGLLASNMASAGWFGSSGRATPVEIDDAAYVQMDGQRPTMAGVDQVAKLSTNTDRTIIRFDLTRKRTSGYVDQYVHGLLASSADGARYEIAYDRLSGLISYQVIEQVHRASGGGVAENSRSVEILRPTDPVIPQFLNALIDQFGVLTDLDRKKTDCDLANRLKQSLPLDAFSSSMPARQVLYGRNLKMPAGCDQVFRQVELDLDGIFELISSINLSSGSGRFPPQAFFADSPMGMPGSALVAKLQILARTGEFRPINYDLAVAVPSFSLDPRNQFLLVKANQTPNFVSREQGGSVLGIRYDAIPTVWDSEDGLKHLRSMQLK